MRNAVRTEGGTAVMRWERRHPHVAVRILIDMVVVVVVITVTVSELCGRGGHKRWPHGHKWGMRNSWSAVAVRRVGDRKWGTHRVGDRKQGMGHKGGPHRYKWGVRNRWSVVVVVVVVAVRRVANGGIRR